MKEVTPKELRKLNSKSFKNTQKIFRKRLREIAAEGMNEAKYKEDDYCAGEYIKGWLRSLGFTCKEIGYGSWVEVTWPQEEDILERFRGEQFQILTSSIPAEAHYATGWLKTEYGTWAWDAARYEYKCSKCGKHAKYVSDYCPNCGKKMIKEER